MHTRSSHRDVLVSGLLRFRKYDCLLIVRATISSTIFISFLYIQFTVCLFIWTYQASNLAQANLCKLCDVGVPTSSGDFRFNAQCIWAFLLRSMRFSSIFWAYESNNWTWILHCCLNWSLFLLPIKQIALHGNRGQSVADIFGFIFDICTSIRLQWSMRLSTRHREFKLIAYVLLIQSADSTGVINNKANHNQASWRRWTS